MAPQKFSVRFFEFNSSQIIIMTLRGGSDKDAVRRLLGSQKSIPIGQNLAIDPLQVEKNGVKSSALKVDFFGAPPSLCFYALLHL